MVVAAVPQDASLAAGDAIRGYPDSRSGWCARVGPSGLGTDKRVVGGWGVRSKWNGAPRRGNRSVSCVRTGEAKLRGRTREMILPLLLRDQDKCSPTGVLRLPASVWCPGALRCPGGVTAGNAADADADADADGNAIGYC